MHIHQNNSTLHAQSLNDIAKPPAILVAVALSECFVRCGHDKPNFKPIRKIGAGFVILNAKATRKHRFGKWAWLRFSEFSKKITLCFFQLPNCGCLQQGNRCRKMCRKTRRKTRRKNRRKSAENFSVYNSSVLRPWRDAFGRPLQTRHTDPSPNAAPAREFLDFG